MPFLYTSLRGVALSWYEGLGRNQTAKTWVAFRPAFLSCFAPTQTARSAVITLHDIKQGSSELVVAFHSRIMKVLNIYIHSPVFLSLDLYVTINLYYYY